MQRKAAARKGKSDLSLVSPSALTGLFNAGSGVFADVETITIEQFEASWRVNALGALLCAKQVIPPPWFRRALFQARQ